MTYVHVWDLFYLRWEQQLRPANLCYRLFGSLGIWYGRLRPEVILLHWIVSLTLVELWAMALVWMWSRKGRWWKAVAVTVALLSAHQFGWAFMYMYE